MQYHLDKSTYELFNGFWVVMIGWLGKENKFESGEVDSQFMDKLFNFCINPTIFIASNRPCDFCKLDPNTGKRPYPRQIIRNGQEVPIYDDMMIVEDDGLFFCAPTLIYHYIESHSYKPPNIFVNAVLKSCPNSFTREMLNGTDLVGFLSLEERNRLGRNKFFWNEKSIKELKKQLREKSIIKDISWLYKNDD